MLSRPRWRVLLVWYMRTLACVWLAKGVFNWFVIFGVADRFADFSTLPKTLQISIGFFAAADLAAAIGMWLAAPWGGAMWLLIAASETTTPLLGSRASFITSFGVVINLALILGYVAVNVLAARDRS